MTAVKLYRSGDITGPSLRNRHPQQGSRPALGGWGSQRFATSRRATLRCVTASSITTALDLGLFAILIVLAGLQPDGANVLSHGCGIIIGFMLTRSWARRDARGDVAEQLTRFAVVGLASLLLSTMMVTALSTAIPALFAKMLSLPIMSLWSFSMPDASFSPRRVTS